MLVWSSIVALLGVVLFCKGFFTPPQTNHGLNDDEVGVAPQFDRAVVMVIDAWRADFAFDAKRSHFSFLHSLINSGNAIPYTAFAPSPTVTLPRLKGLTSGAAPNFLDAVLNIADDIVEENDDTKLSDSWVTQAHRAGKKLRLFGDDTWQRLFSSKVFDPESDGTKSFYVTDFVEVDQNVTRHLDSQLYLSSSPQNRAAVPPDTNLWDILILHYLGLDHIGHQGGASSVHMPGKHEEMDGIIKRIYKTLDDRTLFVVLGDHGMTETGNHGGSTEPETSPALLFLGKSLSNIGKKLEYSAPVVSMENTYSFYKKVQQVDVVPTLSVLLGFPIAQNSLGVFLPEFLDLYNNEEDKMNIARANLQQLGYKGSPPTSLESSFEALYKTQESMLITAATYRMPFVYLGVISIILAGALCAVAMVIVVPSRNTPRFAIRLVTIKIIAFVLAGIFAGIMSASSFVEEEHYYWLWTMSAGLVAMCVARSRVKHPHMYLETALVLAALRVIRGWHAMGQKYADLASISKWLVADAASGGSFGILTWWVVIVYYGSFFVRLNQATGNDKPLFVCSSAAVFASFVFKLTTALNSGDYVPRLFADLNIFANTNPVSLARAVFLAMGLSVGVVLFRVFAHARRYGYVRRGHKTTPSFDAVFKDAMLRFQSYDYKRDPSNGFVDGPFSILWELFLITQSRLVNIPIFALFTLIRRPLLGMCRYNSPIINGMVSTAIQHVAFFCLGNSNSLASIDLTNAYNGVSSYNIPVVSSFTFINNWAGPLYWAHAFSVAGFASSAAYQTTVHLFYMAETLGIFGSTMMLRHHLFIWTVFCPKILYTCAWLLHHLVTSLVFR